MVRSRNRAFRVLKRTHHFQHLIQYKQAQAMRKVNKADKLVDQFIQDLNEINYTPFFDVESPYELALNIFQYLSRTELG
ncbi:hypothetical protein J4Q44_G00229640 [Coregonus suidteri]|uniref:Uncharacterized protein n=1 Tax=Coregonus suidteri TaxID=861788 RepID=A0AAN8L5K7_9TELE